MTSGNRGNIPRGEKKNGVGTNEKSSQICLIDTNDWVFPVVGRDDIKRKQRERERHNDVKSAFTSTSLSLSGVCYRVWAQVQLTAAVEVEEN